MRALVLLMAAMALAACGGSNHGTGGGAGGGNGGGAGGGTPELALNDVSWLFPLPDWSHRNDLLGLDDSGAQGALMPRALYNQLLPLMSGETLDDTHDRVRIVSVRVDPCFPATVPPAPPACAHQIRLVAQPVTSNAQLPSLGSNQLSTDDATIHLFYTLSEAQWSNLVDDVRALKPLAGDETKGPLAVHPTMKREGLNGEYASALKTLILKYAGNATLTRVAEMDLQAFFDSDKRIGAVWAFVMFTSDGTTLTKENVARVDEDAQGVQETGTSASRQGSLNPSPPNDDFDTLLTVIDTAQADQETLKSAFQSALSFENPNRSSPRAIDCGSCHEASRARTAAQMQMGVDTSTWDETFQDPAFDLRRVDDTPIEPHTLRAFGYFFTQTAFSQRTINDSAVTARKLSP